MILSDDEIIGIKDYAELIRKLEILAKDCHWPLMAEAADAIDELRRDAARYRWLRVRMDRKDVSIIKQRNDPNPEFDEEVDQAIDAAIKESK